MKINKEIVRIALVGTQRSNLSLELIQSFKDLGIQQKNKEESILTIAAISAKMQKLAFSPIKINHKPSSKIWQETDLVCNKESIKHLYMIMDGAFENALPEYLNILASQKKCLPPEILPNLLERSVTNPDLWGQLKNNIGQRGLWLIQQNPNWKQLTKLKILNEWDEALNDERLIILEHLLENDPEIAIEKLEDSWSSESVNQKIKFLKILEKNPDTSIEPFLEELLDDRRKEIRRAAVQILSKIPSSSLSKRTFERLKKRIQIHKKGKKITLEISLPDKLENDMIRDGIDPRIQWFKGGVKASRMGQMIALVSPELWLQEFEKEAEDVLVLFETSEWSELIIQAIIEATILHQNKDWARALLSFSIRQKDNPTWQSLNINRLFDHISNDGFNTVAVNGMKATKGLLEENSPLTLLLKNCKCLWNDELTILVIRNLQNWLIGENSRYWNGWHYRTILKNASYLCNPHLHQQLILNWPEESRIWSSWEKEIDEFLSTLHFRKKMIIALEE